MEISSKQARNKNPESAQARQKSSAQASPNSSVQASDRPLRLGPKLREWFGWRCMKTWYVSSQHYKEEVERPALHRYREGSSKGDSQALVVSNPSVLQTLEQRGFFHRSQRSRW